MKNKTLLPLIILFAALAATAARATAIPPDAYRTSFQTSWSWDAKLHLPADVAITYGADINKVEAWSKKGYTVWAMFGASWLDKNTDVVLKNPEIAQMNADGTPFEMIKGRAWVVPVGPWIRYSKEMAGNLVMNGARGILPEEPEFFASTGYSESFKKEWKTFYAEDWKRPDSSISQLWKANRLKAYLFTEYYRDLFKYVKTINKDVLCLVPAHSNLNYADWNIVAPQADFITLANTDGMVGQIWTGTAKGRHWLGGQALQSVFDYSYLEYNYFRNLAYNTKKMMALLTDPVEDAPGATWETLRGWYEETLTAALLQAGVNRYEISPWPERVLAASGIYGGPAQPEIPQDYATELLAVWQAQRQIPNYVTSFESGTPAIGMLTSDSLMWQRGAEYDRFDGHVAPMLSLIRRGIPVAVLSIERLAGFDYPPPEIKIIIASFDAWKPLTPGYSTAMIEWIQKGGTLLFLGGTDDFDSVETSWWRTAGMDSPAEAFLSRLLNRDVERHSYLARKMPGGNALKISVDRKTLTVAGGAPAGAFAFSKAAVPLPVTLWNVDDAEVWLKTDGKPVVWSKKIGGGAIVYAGFPGEAVAQTKEGEELFISVLKAAANITSGAEYRESDRLVMRRGPFVIAHSVKGSFDLEGPFINLLRPTEPVREKIAVADGGNAFALDLAKVSFCKTGAKACLAFAGASSFGEKETKEFYEFRLSGPEGRNGAAWVYVPGGAAPKNVKFHVPGKGSKADSNMIADWDEKTRILRLLAPLSPEGTFVKLFF